MKPHAALQTAPRDAGTEPATDQLHGPGGKRLTAHPAAQQYLHDAQQRPCGPEDRPQTLDQWEHRCQKPDHRRVGNWLARRVARPAALRVTRVVVPWGIQPHLATFTAWAIGTAAVVALGWGSPAGWLVGAVLLHLWYLLDHVDGQIARYHRCETLDGAQLDYLMHHTINLLVPIGMGWGLNVARDQPAWTLLGVAAGLGLLMLGLVHDARYKAFVKRWKRLRGELVLQGGGGGRPQPPGGPPSGYLRRAAWLMRKLCEVQCLLTAIPLLAMAMYLADDRQLTAGAIYLLLLAVSSLLLSAISLARNLQQQAAEREFAAWFCPAEGYYLAQHDGWWDVCPLDSERTQP